MQKTMLKSQLHRITVTEVELHCEESCAIDENLMDEASISEYQQIDIYNVENGERFSTYAISAERGSGRLSVNGAAARRVTPGDLLIICSYAAYSEAELSYHRPDLIYVDARNRLTRRSQRVPVQAAA